MIAGGRARAVAYWMLPSLLCLAVQWPGFTAWFRADDFAWLGLGLPVRTFGDFLHAMFAPLAQGTIRPWSERAFFMTGFALFGLDALPFRIVVFATMFANLVLAAAIGTRLGGRRSAGFLAAIFWAMNGSLVEPLGWTCVYNQVMCAFFLLLAFFCLLRFIETGRRRYEVAQWAAFLLGFGALELNVVYPALAAGYTFLAARRHFRRTLPLFLPSAVYAVAHTLAAPPPAAGDYALHFTGAMLATLGRYWAWSVGPVFLRAPVDAPAWLVGCGIAALSAGLLGFVLTRRGEARGRALFCLLWYVAVLAPVLPLRDHATEYYVFIPLVGLCWLGGWAVAEAWSARPARRALAVALAGLYLMMALPQAVAGSFWNHRVAARVRNLVEGVAGARERHPGKAILLDGIDGELFWNGILDRPFRLIGIERIYLAPSSEDNIEAHPDLGDPGEYILPAALAAHALRQGDLVVYDVRGPRLRNVTAEYAPPDAGPPRRIDAGNPLAGYLLGPEWYPLDAGHRWMPRRATLLIGGPTASGQELVLRGECPAELLRTGPLPVSVTMDGIPLPLAAIAPGQTAFELFYALPESATGRREIHLAIEAGRTFVPPADPRELALAFGIIEIR